MVGGHGGVEPLERKKKTKKGGKGVASEGMGAETLSKKLG